MSGTEHIDLGTATDEHLYLLARRGTEIAASILYKRYVAIARPLLRTNGFSDEEQTDIVSDAVIRVLKGGSYDVARPLKPYLMTVIHNVARDHGRRRRRLSDQVSTDPLTDEHGYLLVDPDAANFAEASGAIGESIRALIDDWEHSPVWSHRRRQWAAVLRQLLDGRSNRETAAALGLDLRSVQNIIDKHIKPALKPLLDEPPTAC